MDLDNRLGRYRFSMRDTCEHAAWKQQSAVYDLEHIGSDPCDYRRTSASRLHECIGRIFSSVEWCKGYLDRRYSMVTAWSSRFPDVCMRVEDIKGIYKNRPISEGICIMLIACDMYTHTFLPVILDYVLKNINFNYIVLENVSPDMDWAIYLTQINVIIVTPKLNSIFIRQHNSHCMAFERSISTKFTSAFMTENGVELVSTIINITNRAVSDMYTLTDPGCHIAIDSYDMSMMCLPF